MSLISLEDALHYTSLTDLMVSPKGSICLYRSHTPDLESNGYIHKLWKQKEGTEPEELKLPLTGRPIWLDEDTILHTAPQPGGASMICRSDLHSGETRQVGVVPFPASIVAQLDEESFLLQGMVDLRAREVLAGKEGEALEAARIALRQEQEECMIIDEFPFWANGVGVTNKKRAMLFLYRCGELTQLTEDVFTVGGSAYCAKCNTVYFTGAAFTVKRPFFLGIWSLDLNTMERRCLMEEGKYLINALEMHKGRLVVCASLQEGNVIAKTPDLYLLDPKSGEMELFCAKELSMGNTMCTDVLYSGGRSFAVKGDKVYFIATVDESSRLLSCDFDGNLTTLVGGTGTVDCFDICEKGAYFVGMQDMRQQELYFASGDGSFRRVTGFNDAFYQERTLAYPETLSFINSVGTEIRGFVMRPTTPPAEGQYPAILDIHGGPLAAYGAIYYHEMQYWAAQGYYVLFCNPTGSTGRGQAFCDICGYSGEIDYEDIMAFVDHVLEAYPEIDPKRVGVTGGSYGGFMTNWIVGHTDRFAAACSQRSTANNISNEAAADGAPLFIKSNLKLGEERDNDRLWDMSPLKYVDAAVTPTLFIHSMEDYTCYHAEALQMYAAFQRLGVDSRMILFKGENHSLSRIGRPRNRLRRLGEITQWMDRYLKKG